ncbi:hypothetical protein HK102_012904 [Quaeritorhiza haematococci]|nr:hypothetical protein HK102_012904 [Quaeritorhiza haematococci]
MERYYLLISLIISLIFATVPLASGMLGFDTTEQVCWYKSQLDPHTFAWRWATLYAPITLGIFISLVFAIPIVLKLTEFKRKSSRRERRRIERQRRRYFQQQKQLQQNGMCCAGVGVGDEEKNSGFMHMMGVGLMLPRPAKARNSSRYSHQSWFSRSTTLQRFSGAGTVSRSADDGLGRMGGDFVRETGEPDSPVKNDVIPAALHQGSGTRTDAIVKRLIPRILLYPIVPFFGMLPTLICILTTVIFFAVDPAWFTIQQAVRKRFGTGSTSSNGGGSGGGGGEGREGEGFGAVEVEDEEITVGELDTAVAIEAALPGSPRQADSLAELRRKPDWVRKTLGRLGTGKGRKIDREKNGEAIGIEFVYHRKD